MLYIHTYIYIYIYAIVDINSGLYLRRDLLLLLEEENIGLIERPSLRPELEFGNACVIIRTAGMHVSVRVRMYGCMCFQCYSTHCWYLCMHYCGCTYIHIYRYGYIYIYIYTGRKYIHHTITMPLQLSFL